MMHSDDSSMLFKDEKLVGFVPVTNERKVSTVLFTTSCEDEIDKNSFQGGELLFNFLYDINGNQIKVKPKAGNMVVFLSNPYFTHEVLKVKQGRRISLVQWHNAIVN
jgi:SM-20-related protein